MFPQFSVDLEFFRGEFLQHFMVSSSIGFGDEGAEFALTAFEVSIFKCVESILDLLGQRLRV